MEYMKLRYRAGGTKSFNMICTSLQIKAINGMHYNNKISHLCLSSHCRNKSINNGVKDRSGGKSHKSPTCMSEEQMVWGWKEPLWGWEEGLTPGDVQVMGGHPWYLT